MPDRKIHNTPRFAFPISEAIVVAAILSFQFALLVPAVNAARQRQGEPPVLPFMIPLYDAQPFVFLILFPIVVASGVGALLLAVRAVLPAQFQAYLPWKAPPKADRPVPEPVDDSRPALASAVIAVCSTVILLFTASHVRVNRTNRRPVVTWEGPAADYVQELAFVGWALSLVALIGAIYSAHRYRSRWNNLAFVVASGLPGANFFGSCIFGAAVYED